MKQNLDMLYSHELGALLEAVRRDMQAQEILAVANRLYADWHIKNVRESRRLLEVLNPKRSRAAGGLTGASAALDTVIAELRSYQ
ncbi:hypothetical protein [Massilia sp. TN1-12]|uniref:hypothetical protein n=1 Tax=Massilia paldalensis TaxID=3377675 RepID=UPI00384EDEB5